MNTQRIATATRAACVLLTLLGSGCQTSETVREDVNIGFDDPDGKRGSILDSQARRLKKKIELYPKRADFRYRLAMISMSREDYHGAVEQLRAAIEIDSNNTKYFYQLGRAYLNMNEHQLAIEAFENAIHVGGEKRFSGLHQALGFTLTLVNRWAEARKQFEIMLEIDPETPLPHYFLGSIADIQQDRDQAIRHMREYLEGGGRLFRKKAIEVLNFHGVAVELESKTLQAAEEQGIGTTGLRGGEAVPNPTIELPELPQPPQVPAGN